MTDAEKKMKKYVNAVERHLNLPKDVKIRVMSDFSSSIQARREAGMTDEEIYAELGDAKKAAATLNDQMQEFAYRKSPWRFLFGAIAAYGGAQIMGGLWALIWYWIMTWRHAPQGATGFAQSSPFCLAAIASAMIGFSGHWALA